jgi:hypothetical protein
VGPRGGLNTVKKQIPSDNGNLTPISLSSSLVVLTELSHYIRGKLKFESVSTYLPRFLCFGDIIVCDHSATSNAFFFLFPSALGV